MENRGKRKRQGCPCLFRITRNYWVTPNYWAAGAELSFFRQDFMNALRSALWRPCSLASMLHRFIFACWAVTFFGPAGAVLAAGAAAGLAGAIAVSAATAEKVTAANTAAISADSSLLIVTPFYRLINKRIKT